MPKKRPDYRADRLHEDFLTNLKDHISSVEVFEEKIENQLAKKFDLCQIDEINLKSIVEELFFTTNEKDLKLLVRTRIESVTDHHLAFLASAPAPAPPSPSTVSSSPPLQA